MGTNYYFEPKKRCECCDRPFEQIHIGKSSYGWAFGLHIYPSGIFSEKGDYIDGSIDNLDEWKAYAKNGYIYNEYDDEISYDEMWNIIENRGNGRYAPEGDKPLHHQTDYRYCIDNEDTYDLMIGNFS